MKNRFVLTLFAMMIAACGGLLELDAGNHERTQSLSPDLSVEDAVLGEFVTATIRRRGPLHDTRIDLEVHCVQSDSLVLALETTFGLEDSTTFPLERTTTWPSGDAVCTATPMFIHKNGRLLRGDTATFDVTDPDHAPPAAACGDAVCDDGETCDDCAADCGECAPICGDGACEGDETCESCADDCAECAPSCGDGVCDGGETCDTCSDDCGDCEASMCGDGVCEGEENADSCPDDCEVITPSGDYEGFGAMTLGADGCDNPETYHVTTLEDGGSGSLRDAIAQGCRHVVFDVGGTITLSDDLDVDVSYLTIDGSTAPAPGITIDHPLDYKVVIKPDDDHVHDVIVRYLRHVGPGGHGETSQDFWGFDANGDFDIYNVVMDHLTLTGSNDGIFDFAHNTERDAYYNITFSWNFIHTQARATSIRGAKGVSWHRNVIARTDDRAPKVTGDSEVDYVNNVTYEWGYICHRDTVAGLALDSDEAVDPKVIARNSVFHNVDTTCGDNPERAIWYQSGEGDSQLYMDGNIVPVGEDDSSNVSSPPFDVPSWAAVTTWDATELGSRVVPCVGTSYPTSDERALLDTISIATGGPGGACPTP